jgi:cytoskeletal protein CcmA (bactofilin family)
MKKVLSFITVFIFSMLLIVPNVNAAIFHADETYHLKASEIMTNNLYSAGANLIFDGEMRADVFAAASNITVNNNISKDFFAAGSNVTINANIGDDIRAAAANLILNGNVAGEAMLAGATVIISENSTIDHDLLVGGANVIINGNVIGNLQGSAEKIEINGTVNGNVLIDDSVEVIVGKNAVINGTLNYSAIKRAQIHKDAVIKGKTTFKQIDKVKSKKFEKGVKKVFGVYYIFKLIITIIFALILLKLFKKKITKMADHSAKKFWPEVLRGFVIFIVAPIAFIVLAITIVGIPFTCVGILLYMLIYIFAKVGGGIICGSMLFKYFKKTKTLPVTWQSTLVGILLLGIVKIIPFIGWIVCAVFFLAAFGTLSIFLYKAAFNGKK